MQHFSAFLTVSASCLWSLHPAASPLALTPLGSHQHPEAVLQSKSGTSVIFEKIWGNWKTVKESVWVTHWKWPGSRPRSLAPSHLKWLHSFCSWQDLRPGHQTLYWRHPAATGDPWGVYLFWTPTQAKTQGKKKEEKKEGCQSLDCCYNHDHHSKLQRSYLSLFPAFSENLPVVAVAWIL